MINTKSIIKKDQKKVLKMKRKNKKNMKNEAENIKGIVSGIVEGKLNLPNNTIILDADVLLELFTKKRLELIQYINSCKPKSIKELAELVGRKKQAVFRDLKILERHELVNLTKKGKEVIPEVKQKLALLNMQEIYSLDIPKKVLCENKKLQTNKKGIKAQVFS